MMAMATQRTVDEMVVGMGVHGERAKRLGQVRQVGVDGIVVRVQRDVYVPFSAVQAIYAGEVVVAMEAGHLPTIEHLLLDETQEEIPSVDGYTVPNTCVFY